MATQVRTCPRCSHLMWLKQEHMDYVDENTVRLTCPHCRAMIRFSLVSSGENATGPKMGQ